MLSNAPRSGYIETLLSKFDKILLIEGVCHITLTGLEYANLKSYIVSIAKERDELLRENGELSAGISTLSAAEELRA